MTDEQKMRDAFQDWYSDRGLSPAAIARNNDGSYRLMQAHSAWIAWQAAWEAALQEKDDGR